MFSLHQINNLNLYRFYHSIDYYFLKKEFTIIAHIQISLKYEIRNKNQCDIRKHKFDCSALFSWIAIPIWNLEQDASIFKVYR